MKYIFFLFVLVFSCADDDSSDKTEITSEIDREKTLDTILNTSNVMVANILNCKHYDKLNENRVVLINDTTSQILATWNHIKTLTGEWEGVSAPLERYNLSTSLNGVDDKCATDSIYNGVLVKKYGDWDHQHANGLVLKPKEENLDIESLNKIVINFYYDLDLSRIPTVENLMEAYGLTREEVENWDKGLLNFDIQLRTKEKTYASFNLELSPDLGNRWLQIEIPVSKLEFWDEDKKTISYESILKHQLNEIGITAETGNRLVYRNINTEGFNEDTPKLFKEIAFRIKRFELVTVATE